MSLPEAKTSRYSPGSIVTSGKAQPGSPDLSDMRQPPRLTALPETLCSSIQSEKSPSSSRTTARFFSISSLMITLPPVPACAAEADAAGLTDAFSSAGDSGDIYMHTAAMTAAATISAMMRIIFLSLLPICSSMVCSSIGIKYQYIILPKRALCQCE